MIIQKTRIISTMPTSNYLSRMTRISSCEQRSSFLRLRSCSTTWPELKNRSEPIRCRSYKMRRRRPCHPRFLRPGLATPSKQLSTSRRIGGTMKFSNKGRLLVMLHLGCRCSDLITIAGSRTVVAAGRPAGGGTGCFNGWPIGQAERRFDVRDAWVARPIAGRTFTSSFCLVLPGPAPRRAPVAGRPAIAADTSARPQQQACPIVQSRQKMGPARTPDGNGLN